MKTVLIAGATGYLGRYLVEAFRAKGYRVRVLVRSTSKIQETGPALAPNISDLIDEVRTGDITKSETLKDVCEGVHTVVSTVSLMAQTSQLTWHDVDFLGNKNLLMEAERSKCESFLYFSVFQAHLLEHVPMVKAHEDFVGVLKSSSLQSTIIRPTGYFSDLKAFFDMAKAGRCYLVGKGENSVNPIHGRDLAEASIEALTGFEREVDIGGPEVLTWNQISRLAFQAIGEKPRLSHIPLRLARAFLEIIRPFWRSKAELWDFFVSSGALNFEAPRRGERVLADFFRDLQANEVHDNLGHGQSMAKQRHLICDNPYYRPNEN